MPAKLSAISPRTAPGAVAFTAVVLQILDNASLTTLGFDRLASIGGALEVVANALLDPSALSRSVAAAPRVKIGPNLADRAEVDPGPWWGDDECDELPIIPWCGVGSDGDDCARYR